MTQKQTTPGTNPEIAINYRLSVQVSLAGLSFLVAEEGTGKVHFFSERTFPSPLTPDLIEEEIRQQLAEPELDLQISSTVVVYSTELYTLVPKDLFDPKRSSDYLKFNAKILPGDYIAHDKVANSPVVVVYVPLMNVNNLLFDRFGSFEYYHSATLLIEHFGRVAKNTEDSRVFLNLYHDSFDMLVFKKGELALCNRYNHSTAEDLLYYLLFSLEQLDLNPDRVPVLVAGNITNDDNVFELLYTYVRDVSLYLPNEALNLIEMDQAPHASLPLKLSF